MLAPPELFGIVEENIYRCTEIDPLNFPFLQTLSLNTILSISREEPSPAVGLFARENNIKIAHMQLPPWKISDEEWKLLPDAVVQTSLSYVLNTKYYPLLIIDLSCTFIGVLRKLQHWNLSSIINEYREMSFDRSQYLYELYIELVDLSKFSIPRLRLLDSNENEGKPNGVVMRSDVPCARGAIGEDEQDDTGGGQPGLSQFRVESLPEWYIEQERMWLEDKRRYNETKRHRRRYENVDRM
ncbi:tyrosine phosphatase family-domain-containing protein [Lipomyces tetrasporus]|uniref:Tyrosine phosphatase family-domain-containing protein n=1 Tax=Lipomyces tetrasporus TaxID=54092 RepID=A0AAD7QT61_9ASCO|nr:tyrosine phosphatase family-domain-containing protein [Lipomyces tetrasporus]KAJ8099272.1 tyrosine phosphatase family-domain-containing protein [Lipomyces tetrasporus]